MPHVTVGAVAMNRCASCDSAWLAPESFMNLCTNAESRGAVIAALGSVTAEQKQVTMGTVRYVRCPVCQKTMNRSNFGHTSGIVIDTCKGHGAWFEHDELHRVLDFVARGGLAAAKQGAVVNPDQATVTVGLNILGAPAAAANPNAMRAMLDVMSNDSASSLLHGFFTSLFG
ncbi:MAG TPA: zf-TFIIB domain-containing protein [Gemmatimonadaceae bacterium]|nr:zf-TFIIB domain-containing protein [Gemmatimonadaceae bacterium]